jgi:outer membrane protein TolC
MVVDRCWFALLIVAALASPAGAGTGSDEDAPYVPPDFMAQLPPLPPNADVRSVWRLDLEQALQIAIHQNTGVVVEREQVKVSRFAVDAAKGELEPIVNAFADNNSSDTPTTTNIQGMAGQIVNTTQQDWNVSIMDRLITGAQAQIAFDNNRSNTNAADTLEPQFYQSSVLASITQPILRGFSMDLVVPRADILRAQIASKRERAQLEVTAANVVQATEDAYWDVVLALYAYDLRVRSQKRADDQLALTHRQIDAGLLPPSDLIAAESTLAQRKLDVLTAEQEVERTSDVLRGAMNLPREQWSRSILPTELPSFSAERSSAESALDVALHHRPELRQRELDLQSTLLSLRVAENNQLPAVNLGLNGSLFGVGTTYRSALDELGAKRDATGYAITLSLSWTPFNETARANASIAQANRRIAAANRDQAVQDTWSQVREAVRNQSSAERQVLAAAKFRELATENLAVEQRKFTSGTSSNFFIAQRQEELASAQLSELQAVLAHKKANVALLFAEGALLDARRVVLQ